MYLMEFSRGFVFHTFFSFQKIMSANLHVAVKSS